VTQSKERVVYVNGKMTPESQAVISALDRGFRWGDAVYEVERTFAGTPYKLRAHLDRLYRSLRYTRIDPGMSEDDMERATMEVVEANRNLLGPNDDFTVNQVVSRGLVEPSLDHGANVVIYCIPVHFQEFAREFATGARLITPATRRNPPTSLSPKAKISNKMNHFIAQFEAKAVDPGALALMLDQDGNITEAAGANFVFVADGCLKVPNRRHVLPGISMEAALEMAENQGIPVEEGDYTTFDVYQADEAFLSSTSYCVLPVTSLNGWTIGTGEPGPITQGLLASWSDMVGVNVVDQAMSHIPREEREALSRMA
jgi:branched-chain amino acid aminotransferase